MLYCDTKKPEETRIHIHPGTHHPHQGVTVTKREPDLEGFSDDVRPKGRSRLWAYSFLVIHARIYTDNLDMFDGERCRWEEVSKSFFLDESIGVMTPLHLEIVMCRGKVTHVKVEVVDLKKYEEMLNA